MDHILKALDNAIALKEFAIESLKKENDALKKENASLISKIYHLEAKLHSLQTPCELDEEGGVENVE